MFKITPRSIARISYILRKIKNLSYVSIISFSYIGIICQSCIMYFKKFLFSQKSSNLIYIIYDLARQHGIRAELDIILDFASRIRRLRAARRRSQNRQDFCRY